MTGSTSFAFCDGDAGPRPGDSMRCHTATRQLLFSQGLVVIDYLRAAFEFALEIDGVIWARQPGRIPGVFFDHGGAKLNHNLFTLDALGGQSVCRDSMYRKNQNRKR